jgi:Fic family protein
MHNNNKYDKRLENLPVEIWSRIARIDELKGQWVAGARLSPQTLGRLKRSVLVTSTGASTRIEGAKMSDEDIEKMLRGISIQKFADRDKQEVRSYYELLQNVFDASKSIKLSENSIKHFHKELLKYVEKDERHRGEYKKIENKVHMVDAAGKSIGVLFDTTPPYLTPKEMHELIEWAQLALAEKKYHPLLVIANLIIEFLAIHPFQDGNGRLSRILTNLLLLKEGYEYVPYVSHEKIIEDNKPDYYLALRKSQKTLKTQKEDITPWLDFFLSTILKQTEMAVQMLQREDIEKILSPKQLAVWHCLQAGAELTPAVIAARGKVARPTVNQALNKLLKLKKIERLGSGRTTRYRLIQHD